MVGNIIMGFQKKKITEKVRGILGKYLDGTESEFREATERVVDIIQAQHNEKLELKAKGDNTLIASDKSVEENSMVDLSKCKKGDILISTHGAKLEYISPTPWRNYTYLDHVVRYIEDANGISFGLENYGTRTNDGFTFAENRNPEIDHDIAGVIKH